MRWVPKPCDVDVRDSQGQALSRTKPERTAAELYYRSSMGSQQKQIESDLATFYNAESATRDQKAPGGRRRSLSADSMKQALPAAPARVLDLGAGPGLDSRTLVAAGYQVTAFDLATENAKRCVSYGAPAVVGTIQKLPFASSSFDALWSLSVLMHIHDEAIDASLQEIQRVLRPGAIAVIGTWGGQDKTVQIQSEAFGIDRHFRHRSDDIWQDLLISNLGGIESFVTWSHAEHEAWHYQWAHVRVE